MSKHIAVGVVVENSRVLMLHRAVPEGDLAWQFPAGQLKLGETPKDAVVREVGEETGISARVVREIGERMHPTTGVKLTYFLLEPTEPDLTIHFAPREAQEVRYMTGPEALNIITSDIFPPIRELLEGLRVDGGWGKEVESPRSFG